MHLSQPNPSQCGLEGALLMRSKTPPARHPWRKTLVWGFLIAFLLVPNAALAADGAGLSGPSTGAPSVGAPSPGAPSPVSGGSSGGVPSGVSPGASDPAAPGGPAA